MSRDSEERLYTNNFTRRPSIKEIPERKSRNFQDHYAGKIEEQTRKAILDKINKEQKKVAPKSKQINDFLKGKTKTPFGGNTMKFDNSLLTADGVRPGAPGTERYKREKKTIISIDSADRNIFNFPNSNDFTVNLGKTFFNVKSIKLISSEFPNSERVVKGSASEEAQNNLVTWINEEDYQFASPTYTTLTPFEPYLVELNPGNYSINTIDDELDNELNDGVKRLQGTGDDDHFFIVESNNDNEIISLSSFKKFNLNSINPVSTIFTSGAVEFSDEAVTNKSFFLTIFNHGIRDNNDYLEWEIGDIISVGTKRKYNNVVYEAMVAHTADSTSIPPVTQTKWRKYFYQGNTLYVNGLQSTGGIPSSNMNGTFTNFKVTSVNTIQVFIGISCSFTDAGGGNTGVVGVSQPLQLQFGDNENNIGRVLGFPQENSSEYIKEGNLSTTTFRIKDITPGTKTTFLTQVVYAGNNVSISSGGIVTITTSIPHELLDGDEILIQDSTCIPNIDSFITDSYLDQTYYTVTKVSDTSFQIPVAIDVVTAGDFCTIIFPDGDNQLASTAIFTVSSLAPFGDPSFTTVTTTATHGLSVDNVILLITNSITGTTSLPALNSNFTITSIVSPTQFNIRYTLEGTFTSPLLVSKVKFGGDKIRIDNAQGGIFSTPTISGEFLVEEATTTSFKIDFETSFIDQTTIKEGIIESDVVTVYHPNHFFNRVIRDDNNEFRFDIGNNRLILQENTGDKFGLVYPTGTYTSSDIISYLGPALSAISPNSRTYTISFPSDVFTITISSGTFKILGTESNILPTFRIAMSDTSLASSFSGSTLLSNSTYLLPHRLYGQTLKILDIQDDSTQTLTASLWVGKLGSDTSTGDGIKVNYTSSYPIIFPDANEIYVNGILQTDGVDYTYVAYSTTITFTVAPGPGVPVELKTVITTQVDTSITGDGATSVFTTDDDILDTSLVAVYDFGGAAYLTQGVDYTVTLPRTITFTVTPIIDALYQIENIVNNSFMSKEQPSGEVAGSYVYTGALPNPTSYVILDGSYNTVNVENTSVIRIPSERNISGYTNAGTNGPSGQPFFYNSGGILETDYNDYTSHRITPTIDILDSYSIDTTSTFATDTILGAGDNFKLYRVDGIPVNTDKLLGIKLEKLNNNIFSVNKILNKDYYNFKIPGQYSDQSSFSNTEEIYMSSYVNGFSYKQDNSGVSAGSGLGSGPFSGLKLSGNNYVYLTSPGLETIVNTNIINDVFAKILLSEPPGNIIFNSFVSNAKLFDETPLAKLEELQFKVIGGDKFLYDFNNNDFSFSLEVIEYVDSLKNTGISSRTGTVDTSGQLDTVIAINGSQKLVDISSKNK